MKRTLAILSLLIAAPLAGCRTEPGCTLDPGTLCIKVRPPSTGQVPSELRVHIEPEGSPSEDRTLREGVEGGFSDGEFSLELRRAEPLPKLALRVDGLRGDQLVGQGQTAWAPGMEPISEVPLLPLPFIRTVSTNLLSTKGDEVLQIDGDHFGAQAEVLLPCGAEVDPERCPRAQVLMQEGAQIRARTPAGKRGAAAVRVRTADGRISDAYPLRYFPGNVKFDLGLSADGAAMDPGANLAVADVNGDLRPDVVLGRQKGTVQILFGENNRAMRARTYTTGKALVAIAAVDLNGDGIGDLVLGQPDGVEVYLGQRVEAPPNGPLDMAFKKGQELRLQMGESLSAMAVGLIDGDAQPDLLLLTSSKALQFHRGRLTGDFSLNSSVSEPLALPSIAIGDLDGQGGQEVALLRQSAILIFSYDGTRGELAKRSTMSHSVSSAVAVYLSDRSGDRRADLLLQAQEKIYLSVTSDKGEPGPLQVMTAPGLLCLAQGDFNDDGRADLLLGHRGAPMQLLTGQGDGQSYAAPRFIQGNDASILRGHDLDGDGLLDIVRFEEPSNLTRLRPHYNASE